MTGPDPVAGSRQDYFIARLELSVDTEPMRVIDEWSSRFTDLREAADYDGCRMLLQSAKSWSTLPPYCRGVVYYAEGWLYDRLADRRLALRSYTRARDAFTESGMTQALSAILTQIGSIQHDMGDLQAAQETYRTVLDDAAGQQRGRLLINMGTIALEEGNGQRAAALFDEALDVLDPEDHHNVAAAYHGRGNAYELLHRPADAQAQFHRAYSTAAEAGDVFTQAAAAASLGVLELTSGTPANAVELFTFSLAVFQRLQDTIRVAATLNNLAIAHQLQGFLPRAEALWRQAESVYVALGDESAAAQVRDRAERALGDQSHDAE